MMCIGRTERQLSPMPLVQTLFLNEEKEMMSVIARFTHNPQNRAGRLQNGIVSANAW